MSKLFTLAVAILAIGATPACNRTTHTERPSIALVLKIRHESVPAEQPTKLGLVTRANVGMQ
jgi:hypothetical protein